jgi:polygalacturonase
MQIHENSRCEFLSSAAVFTGAGTLPLVARAQEKPALEGRARDSSANFNVRDFGAAGDGRRLDTNSVDKAVEAAARAGGTVVFPGGSYLCHSIHLKSNVALLLERGATIATGTTA